MAITAKGTVERSDQIASLKYPRACVDADGDFVDRFVVDNKKSSGRVYDRLYGREVPRLIPHMEGIIKRHVYDVFEDRLRRRIKLDDMRDAYAKRSLEITEDERHRKYFSALDVHFSDEEESEGREAEDSEANYDADSEMTPCAQRE
jgi:hypothetical protein